VCIPHGETEPQKVSEKPLEKGKDKKGVKGMFPLGCLPLWGREGVTLIISKEHIRFLQRAL
jgi:hypothetical protein